MKTLTLVISIIAFAETLSAQTFEVRAKVESVDADNLRFVAAHESIPGFMEAMTMPFEVRERDELDGVAPGDKLTFTLVVDEGGTFVQSIVELPNNAKLVLADEAIGHEHSNHHAHVARAPAGVMADHRHHSGGRMLSYRFMEMRMGGIYEGSNEISADQLLSRGYMVAPDEMTMQMHMFGAMYAPNDEWTLMAMANYSVNEMAARTRMGMKFTTQSEGWGDATVGSLKRIRVKDTWGDAHLGLMFSLPTGSTDETHASIPMDNKNLPYRMQLGSGTYDLRPSFTWTKSEDDWSWGAQVNSIIRLGRNSDGYRLGNRIGATTWLSREISWLRISGRISAEEWGNVSGSDEDLSPMAPMMNVAMDPSKQGGRSVEASLGLETNLWKNTDNPVRVAVEWGTPVYQNLDGPQMGTESNATLAVSRSF